MVKEIVVCRMLVVFTFIPSTKSVLRLIPPMLPHILGEFGSILAGTASVGSGSHMTFLRMVKGAYKALTTSAEVRFRQLVRY